MKATKSMITTNKATLLTVFGLQLIIFGLTVGCQEQQQQPLDQLPADQKLPAAGKQGRQCVPMLNLANYLSSNNYSSQAKTNNDSHPINSANPQIIAQSFSFPIGDIDMPVTSADSSMGSAMRLISTFGSQMGAEEDLEAAEQPDNVVRFRENRLLIQGLNLSMLNVHLYTDSEPKFGIGIVIKNTTLTGKFDYNGPLLLTDSKLSGYYRMSIDNIYLVTSSNLRKVRDDQNSTNLSMRANNFNMNITNLGYISIDIFDSADSSKPTSNYLLRLLQRLLQRTIKRTYYSFEEYIRQALEVEGKQALDCELTRFSPLLDKSGPTNHHQSDLARIISGEIVRFELNSVSLPDFEHQQSILGSSALIQFYNGSLDGLERIKLNAETRIKLQDQHLFMNTSIGWSDLRPYYNWSLYMGSSSLSTSRSSSKPPTSKGFVSFNIKAIDFDAVITKGLNPQDTRIVVDQLLIKRLDNPKMDISGLPGMNRLTRGIVNFFMGRLKQRLVSSIQPALKQQLERSLNRMSSPLAIN